MTGIAVVMVVGQLGKVTGVTVTGDSVTAELRSFLTHLDQVQWNLLLLSAATLTFLLVVAWRWPWLPGPLLAVLLATALTAVLDLEAKGVRVVGELPAGLPAPGLPPLGDYLALLLPAAGVLLVGYTDNVLTARAFAVRGGYAIDPDQEFLALGGRQRRRRAVPGVPGQQQRQPDGDRRERGRPLPAALAGRRRLRRRRAAVPASGPGSFPLAALGAIVIYAATRLVDVGEFRRLARFRLSELALALVTLGGVLVFGVLKGILVAVAVSAVEMLRRIARPHDAVLGRVSGLLGMHDVDDYPGAVVTPGLLVYRYDAPLFFANARDFKQRALAAATERGEQLRLVRAERGGERRARHHGARRGGGGPRRARRTRHRVRGRPRQAGRARDAGGLRDGRPDRAGPALPDVAGGGGRLPPALRRGPGAVGRPVTGGRTRMSQRGYVALRRGWAGSVGGR